MVHTSVPEKTSHKTSIVPKHTPMPKAVLPSPKHTSASEVELTHEEERIALINRSDQCLQNMVRFSMMTGTKQSDL